MKGRVRDFSQRNARGRTAGRDRVAFARYLPGFTVVELFVSLGILGLLLGLLLPAVQQVRESSRASSCRNNLHQLITACHEHESLQHRFPYTSTVEASPDPRNGPRSPFVDMMPWLDPASSKQFDQSESAGPGWDISDIGYYSAHTNRELHQLQIPVLNCPSDSPREGGTNYRANVGLAAVPLREFLTTLSRKPFGAFEHRRTVRAAEFRDGLSNTAMFSERVYGGFNRQEYYPFRDSFGIRNETADVASVFTIEERIPFCQAWGRREPASHFSFMGGMWMLGGLLNTWYQHGLSPNSPIPDCSDGTCCGDGGSGVVAARSLHPSGVHVGMADGAIRQVSSGIDLAVWRASGTRESSD